MVRGAGPGGVQAAGADTPGHQLLGDQESVPAAGAAAEPGGQPGHGHQLLRLARTPRHPQHPGHMWRQGETVYS